MGRPERFLDPSVGPLAAFAHELRALRESAGRPTYAAMGRKVHRSASTLAEAAGGGSAPSLDTTLAYVSACGGDPVEWEQRWREMAALRSTSAGSTSAGSRSDAEAAASADAPARNSRPIIVLVAFAVLLIVVWALANEFGRKGSTSSAEAAAVPKAEILTISSPSTGSPVRLLDDVTIQRSGDAPGRYVWITIQFAGGAVVNPQGECFSKDGRTYSCDDAQFGTPTSDPGTEFLLTAVLVDEPGNLALRSLRDDGYNAATHPVPFLAQSAVIRVAR